MQARGKPPVAAHSDGFGKDQHGAILGTHDTSQPLVLLAENQQAGYTQHHPTQHQHLHQQTSSTRGCHQGHASNIAQLCGQVIPERKRMLGSAIQWAQVLLS